jgi:hypothetical protein
MEEHEVVGRTWREEGWDSWELQERKKMTKLGDDAITEVEL